MLDEPLPLAIAILAGGQSKRMGSDKSFVELLGRPLIEHVLAGLEMLRDRYPGAPIFIVSNNGTAYHYLDLPVYPDVLSYRASLSGLYSALWHSPARFTLCVACDMPFLNPTVLDYLIRQADGCDAVIPRIDGQLETLHAVYSKSCLDPIHDALKRQELKIARAIADVNTKYIDVETLRRFDPALSSFRNLNTPDDLVLANRVSPF